MSLFDSWTPENDMKMSSLWPTEYQKDANGDPVVDGSGNKVKVDRDLDDDGLNDEAVRRINGLLCLARKTHKKVRGHTLLFASDPAIPDTLKDLSKTEVNNQTKNYVQTVMREFQCGPTRPKTEHECITNWDVVNEPLKDAPSSGELATKGERGFWYRNIGPDWVTKAFEWAHTASNEASPKPELLLNEKNADLPDTNTARFKGARQLLRQARRAACPSAGNCQRVGLGFQMHRSATVDDPTEDVTVKQYKTRWKNFINVGRSGFAPFVEITEMDVAFSPQLSRQPNSRDDADELADQRDSFQRVAESCRAFPRCGRFTAWGVSDRFTFRDDFDSDPDSHAYPLLLDWQGRIKLALRG